DFDAILVRQPPQRQNVIVPRVREPVDGEVDPVGPGLDGDADQVLVSHRLGRERLAVGIGDETGAEAGLARSGLRDAGGSSAGLGGSRREQRARGGKKTAAVHRLLLTRSVLCRRVDGWVRINLLGGGDSTAKASTIPGEV